MASDGSKFSIPIFDGKTDFTVWKMTIEDVLVQQGIDEALLDTRPEKIKDDDWKTMQKKASSTIRLALAPEIKYSVLKENTPKGIWDKLASIYASKSLTNRLFLKMDLYSLKLEEGGNLHDHINSFNQLVCRLSNVDEVMKDEEQALLMLSSLSKSYKPFVQTMLSGRTTLTLEDVLKALRDNERMTRTEGYSTGENVLATEDSNRGRGFNRGGGSRGRSKSRGRGDRDMSNVKCYYCNETGHMQIRCPQFREDLKSMRNSKEGKKGNETNVVTNDVDEFFLTESSSGGILKDEKPKWVLDNAASVHICNDRAMFDTLNENEEYGDIKVGNKHKMKVEGVGSVRFKLHDGVVKTALNVKYVPNASANILSLGILTSRGYRYVAKKNTCKVYKKDKLVIRGWKNSNNICYLDGISLVGRTCLENKNLKKTEKRVHFSDRVKILGNLGQGRI